MTGHDDRMAALTDAAEADMGPILDRWAAGELADHDAADDAADLLMVYRARAQALGTLEIDAVLAGAGRPVTDPDTEPGPGGNRARITESAAVRLALVESVARIYMTRLARIEPLNAHADTLATQIEASEDIAGWQRVAEPDACPLCTDKDGDTAEPAEPMWRHTGCACTQTPQLTD